jgi:DNA-binding NarL/FixJ family response regulator
MKKILIIEDELEMRRNIAALLRYYDYGPIVAENGRAGVEAARREKPDLILCDVMMPELDGYGVLQSLQTDASLAQIPFIFLTAKGEKDDLRSGMNLGADDYLTKPVANADLVRAIEARLRRSEQQAKREFRPDFSSFDPLLKLGLTRRAAEALLWLAQGKTNSDIATILGITESTVKKYVQEMFDKLGVETRGAATVLALEILNSEPQSGKRHPGRPLTGPSVGKPQAPTAPQNHRPAPGAL